jgi:ribonuclease VapC
MAYLIVDNEEAEQEPERERFIEMLARAGGRRLGATGVVELTMVLSRTLGSDAGVECDEFLRESGILVEPVTRDHAVLARDAFLKFGKGRHPAA